MTIEIKETLSEIQKGIVAMQSSNDELSKKYDGLKNQEIKEMGEKMDSVLKSYEEQKSEIEESKERSKKLEALLSRGGEKAAKEDSNKEYKSAFCSYLRKRDSIDSTKTDEYIRSVLEEEFKGTSSKDLDVAVKTLRSDIGPDGGYFIMPDLAPVKKGRYFETTPMTRLATVLKITSNEVVIPLDDNEMGALEFTGQIDAPSDTSTPKIGQIKILANEVQAKVGITQSMLDDVPNADQWLLEKINNKFDRGLNTTYVSGTGSNQAKGFLTYDAWTTPSTIAGVTGTYERNKLEQIDSGVSAGLSADGFRTTQAALKEDYQDSAVWLMKRMTWNTAVLSKDGVGQYLINPRFFKEGTDLELLGRPVVFANDMQAVGASALSVAYGDFKEGYTIVERLGMRILRDPYTATPKVLFKAFKRTGGAVTNFESIKLLKCGA